jgi:cell division protein FtsL
VKWKNLPYEECTWETEDLIATKARAQIQLFRERNKLPQSMRVILFFHLSKDKKEKIFQFN